MISRIVAILIACLMVSACSGPPQPQKAAVHPDAHSAKLFIDPVMIEIDDKGRPSQGSYPRKGIRLTAEEMQTVQNSFTYAPSKKYAAVCCIPRHAFVFYGKDGKYIGNTRVCFECSCAYISGSKPPSDKLNNLIWDEAALEKIIKAHGQTVRFES